MKRAVRLAQRVASSIRRGAGTRATEHGESRRRERLGCPAHPSADRRLLKRPARLLQAHHGPGADPATPAAYRPSLD